MQLESHFAGTPLKPYGTRVDQRRTMNYAAAVSDLNPVYFDDERPQGIMAPPMFSTAVTWPILEHIGDHIEAAAFPRELLLTQVHHTEHLCFHRPLVPEAALSVAGRIAAILPHRAGTRVVMRLEARDAEERPVFTEHLGAMLRGVACLGGGRGEKDLPAVPEPPRTVEPLWETDVYIAPERPHLYDGCTGIVFPIHTSPKFARCLGLPGIILQGTATLAFAARELVDREAGGDPGRLASLACRFCGMVLPGRDIRIRLTARSRTDLGENLFFDILNPDGKPVIRRGWALLR
jgi:acyl dehydratase